MHGVQEETGAVGGAMAQPGLAKSIVSGDRIMLTVTAKKRDGSRFAIAKIWNDQGVRIDASGEAVPGASLDFNAISTGTGEEPTFDVEAFRTALLNSNNTEAQRLSDEYQAGLTSHRAQGGTTFIERLGNALYANLQAEDGVKAEDGDHLVLSREQVVVKAPYRTQPSEPGLWVSQLAPTWGSAR